VILALGAVLMSCTHARKGATDDPWLRRAPEGLVSSATRIPKQDVLPVIASQLPSAIARLEQVPFVEITGAEAGQLTAGRVGDGRFYLMRGLCLGCGTGRFVVYFDGRYVAVDHVSLARKRRNPTRWPVIVRLDTAPETAYAQCHSVS
jgi:hypothetical protein